MSKTLVFCEQCLYLFGCRDEDMTELCIICEHTCVLGNEPVEKDVIGICTACLEEMLQ